MAEADEKQDESGEIDMDAVLRELGAETGLTIERSGQGRLMRSLVAGLEEMGWDYRLNQRTDVLTANTMSSNMTYTVVLYADETAGDIFFRLSGGFRVPEDKRVVMCEVLNRANYGLSIGNFEMDMSEGEVGYRVGLDYRDSGITPELVKRLILNSFERFEHYLPAMMHVLYAGASPDRAISEVGG